VNALKAIATCLARAVAYHLAPVVLNACPMQQMPELGWVRGCAHNLVDSR
jgi:hypothetical protein